MTENNEKASGEEATSSTQPDKTSSGTPFPRPSHPPEPKGMSGIVWMALALAIVIGGGFATKPLWLPHAVDYLPKLEGMASLQTLITPKSSPSTMPEPAQAPNPVASPAQKPVKASAQTQADRISELEQELKTLRESGTAIQDLEQERARMNKSMSALMDRLSEVEGKLDNVGKMTDVSTPPSDTANTAESLQRLSQRVAGLSEDGEALSDVLQRLARLEQAIAENEKAGAAKATMGVSTMAQSMVLAIGSLREGLKTGKPFPSELAAVKRLGEKEPDVRRAVEALAAYAAKGIPTLEMLRLDFPGVARSIADKIPAQGGGLVEKTLNQIKSMVAVRRVDADGAVQAPKDATATTKLDAVWQNLERGNLDGAVHTLDEMGEPSRTIATSWLANAHARLEADALISFLNVLAVSLLAPAGK